MTNADTVAMAKINTAIDSMAADPDIIETVKRIESGIKTTQYNYGRYMQFLSCFAKDRVTLFIMRGALLKAGADADGVAWAIKLLTNTGI